MKSLASVLLAFTAIVTAWGGLTRDIGYGQAGGEALLVVRNARIDGAVGWQLWSDDAPSSGLVFVLNSRLAATMSPMTVPLAEGTYFCQTHHVGAPDHGPADNLPSNWGVPSPARFEAKWAFDGEWDPIRDPVGE